MKKIKFSFILVAVALLAVTTACSTTYYEVKSIPDYQPLDEKAYNKTADIAVEADLLCVKEACAKQLEQHGYKNVIYQGLPVSIQKLKTDHIISCSPLNVTAFQTKAGYVVTEHVVVEVRKPGRFTNKGELEVPPPRLFQAFYRMTFEDRDDMIDTFKDEFKKNRSKYTEEQITLIKGGVIPYHDYHLDKLFGNLLRNPKFREALNPSGK